MAERPKKDRAAIIHGWGQVVANAAIALFRWWFGSGG